MGVIFTILIIFVMVAFNAFFVAAEFATVGARKSNIQELANSGQKQALRLAAVLSEAKKMDNYVAACQIGITVSSLVAGAYGQSQLSPILQEALGSAGAWISVTIVLLSVTGVQVVLGELLPKTAALRHPERIALMLYSPMMVAQWIFRPLVAIFNGSALNIMKIFRLDWSREHAHVHSPEELAGLYSASAAGGLIDIEERDRVAGVLNVDKRTVKEIMTPRHKLVTISSDATSKDAIRELADSSHSRFPVVDGEEIVGVALLRKLFVSSQISPTKTVAGVAVEPVEVPEFISVPELWRVLREQRRHCAFVVDEYGTIVGMVTLEDAIEEIFGEVRDEFDIEEEPVVVQGDALRVQGGVPLSLLDEKHSLRFNVDEVDTVNGLVWHVLGRHPQKGDTIQVGEIRVSVEDMDGRIVAHASIITTQENGEGENE